MTLTGADVRVQRRWSVEDVVDPSASRRLHAVQCQAAHHWYRRQLLPSAAAATPDSPTQSRRVSSCCSVEVRRTQRRAGNLQSDDGFGPGVRSVSIKAWHFWVWNVI